MNQDSLSQKHFVNGDVCILLYNYIILNARPFKIYVANYNPERI